MDENCCRLCIENRDKFDLINVFSEHGKSKELFRKLKDVLDINVTEISSLPKSICIFCYNKLEEWWKFSKIVSENQIKLLKLCPDDDENDKKLEVLDEVFEVEEDSDVATVISENEIKPNTPGNSLEVENFSKQDDEPLVSEILHDVRKVTSMSETSFEDFLAQCFPVKCHICETERTFDSILQGREHYTIEHQVVGYLDCCDLFFSEWKDLKSHVWEHIRTESRNDIKDVIVEDELAAELLELKPNKSETRSKTGLTCEYCKKTFRHQSGLAVHIDGKHLGLKFQCNLCSKLYSYKNDLQLHMRNMHQDRKKQKCSVCQAQVFDMKRHMQRHYEKQLDIRCEICGKQFPNNHCLKVHEKRIHSETKHMFSCSYCSKFYSTMTTLKNHESLHTGKMRYKCNYCKREFTNSGNKSKHIQRMHLNQYEKSKKLEAKLIND